MRNESIMASDLFAFDYFACLRSEYAKNSCDICIQLCPEEAMGFDRGRLRLDVQACTGCCGCMGSCPTQALESRMFDPEEFVEGFVTDKGTLVSCKENVPCLGALSAEHFAVIGLESEGQVACDLSFCATCPINREGKILHAIEEALNEAERLIALSGGAMKFRRTAPEETAKATELTDEKRRGLLKRLVTLGAAKEETSKPRSPQEMHGGEEQKRPPKKRVMLQNALKRQAEKFPERTTFDTRFSFNVGKTIDALACTNCQECALFCPTGALSLLQDNTGIVFQQGKCIACAICNDICQPRAIEDDETFDLIAFAFDRMNLLVKHELEICEECKVAFPYKGGEKVCDRCRDFKNNFSDLFTMAKDLDR